MGDLPPLGNPYFMGPYKPLRTWVDEFIPYYMEMSWELSLDPIAHMDVSKNNGTPKSSHFNRVFHYFHHPFWGCSPYFWFNTHMGNLMTPVKTWEFLGKKIHRKVDFFQPEPEAVRLATTKQTRWPPENQVFLMG